MGTITNSNIEMVNVYAPSKGHGHSLNAAAHALQGKIDDFKKLVASTPMTTEEIYAHGQAILQEAKALIPTPTTFATPTEYVGDSYEGVRTYGMVGMWSLTNAEMRNISSTMDVQQSLMNLELGVEDISVAFSNLFLKILQTDQQAVQNATGATPQDKANNINVATNKYNEDSTVMQTFSSTFSSENNLLSNGLSNVGQNLSTDGATVQQVVMKLMDSLSQLLGQI